MTMETQPDVRDDHTPVVAEIDNGLIVPIPDDTDQMQPLNCGVLDDKGEVVDHAITWRNNTQFSLPPRTPLPSEITEIGGTVMFGGLMFGHFGHFLVETTARLWAYEQVQDKIDAIVFVPKVQRNVNHVLNTYAPFMRLLGIEAPLFNIQKPARYDRVLVPQQGFGMFGMIEGLPAYRQFMRDRMGLKIADDGARKLYVSRSALPHQRGGLLGEERIEEHLTAEGYRVFHPQKHSLDEQLAAYKSADFIISPDGSPLHMAALVAKPTAKIAVIARRPDVAHQFELQFRAFCGIETVTIDALTKHWIPVNHARPSRMSYGELDLGMVYNTLKDNGLIAGNTPWSALSGSEHAEIMSALEERQRVGFKLYQPAA